ncbi:MAG: hypothetical protein P8Y70_04875 [Candidatus Lokiarchaeota archaeon]
MNEKENTLNNQVKEEDNHLENKHSEKNEIGEIGQENNFEDKTSNSKQQFNEEKDHKIEMNKKKIISKKAGKSVKIRKKNYKNSNQR